MHINIFGTLALQMKNVFSAIFFEYFIAPVSKLDACNPKPRVHQYCLFDRYTQITITALPRTSACVIAAAGKRKVVSISIDLQGVPKCLFYQML